MQSKFTTRVDGTSQLGKGWIKNVKITMGSNRLDENSQSEKLRVISKNPELLENDTTIRETDLSVRLRMVSYPIKQKQETNTDTFIN